MDPIPARPPKSSARPSILVVMGCPLIGKQTFIVREYHLEISVYQILPTLPKLHHLLPEMPDTPCIFRRTVHIVVRKIRIDLSPRCPSREARIGQAGPRHWRPATHAYRCPCSSHATNPRQRIYEQLPCRVSAADRAQ